MSKKAQITIKIIGIVSITIGGIAIAFGPTQSIKIIGGLLIAVGTGLCSLS